MKELPGFIYTISFLLVIVNSGCTNSEGEHGDQSASSVSDRIAEDLADGSMQPANWKFPFDEPDKQILLADTAHSTITFRTDHWDIVKLYGWFEDFEVRMYTDEPDFSDAEIFARVNVATIRMPNTRMAASVIQVPYVDTKEYPYAVFSSTGFSKTGDNMFKVPGKFEMNGHSINTEFIARYTGHAYPGENSICGFHITGAINRHDFGIAGDDRLHSGLAVHGDTIFLEMSMRME